MYYHPSNHVYIAQFRDELIILNTKKDKYIVCAKKFSGILKEFFDGNKIGSLSRLTHEESIYVHRLLETKIIEPKTVPYPFYLDKKVLSCGVSNVDWRLPLENSKLPFNFGVLKAFFTILKVNYYIKFRGLFNAIQLVKKTRLPDRTYIIPPNEELIALAHIVNKACLLYPIRTKCLEWAMTFVLLALKRGWKCNLEVGVQNYPFASHAWIECDGKVVMDSQDLRKGMAIILNEPFRREQE